MEDNEMMSWDAGLDYQEERKFEILPEGEYEFVITEFEKTFSSSGNNMAKITLDIETEDGQHFAVIDRLILIKKMEWKLSQFFIGLGLQNKGEALTKMPWNKVLGAEGKVAIVHKEYNGKTYANVDKYLAPVGKPKKAKKLPAIEDDDLPFPV